MITEELIKKRFIHDTLSQGINFIYQTQENVVRTHLNTRSGNLLAHLQKRPFRSQISGTKQIFFMRIFPYLRYLDMSYRDRQDRIARHIRSNLALYNRTVWGVLYHETFPELTHGFTNEIRNSIRKELEQALKYK